MARKKKGGILRRAITGLWQFLWGKPELKQRIQTMTGKQAKDADELRKIMMDYVGKKPEKIDVPAIPSQEQLMPGGAPQITQPEFTELPPFEFGSRRAEAERKFMTEQVPALSERFTAMGKGALGSSGFTTALGRARANLTSQLEGLEEKLGQEYAMGKGDLETRQAAVGLTGQGLAAETGLKYGQFGQTQAQLGLKRADLQSMIQQRQRPNLGAYGKFAFQEQFEPVIRPATGGFVGSTMEQLSKFF